MSIDTAIFPLTMSGLNAGPMFSTDITVGKSGAESRNANWQDALWRYNAAYSVKTRSDVDTLRAFFLNRYGREKAFLLQDLSDYKIPQSGAGAQLIGTGNGTQTAFQIIKKYTDQGFTYTRTILRPSTTAADLVVYVNAIESTGGGVNYTYSTTTGIITFNVAPANGLPVTITLAKFWVPVRFDIDALDVDMLTWWVEAGADKSNHQPPNIPMVEVRETS